jgi:hypothetical protein
LFPEEDWYSFFLEKIRSAIAKGWIQNKRMKRKANKRKGKQ